MVFGDQTNDLTLQIETIPVAESREQKPLGITVDKKLITFQIHVESLCKKANQKLHALSHISCYLSTEQPKLTMKTFTLSQSNYCPHVWMFCDRALDNKINRIHEKASGTPMLGGRRGSCPLCLHPWGQEGQELPSILNSFNLCYFLKGHFPALQTVWFKKIFLGVSPQTPKWPLNY